MSKTKKVIIYISGFLFGALVSAFIVFQVLFLIKVIPHGGF